MSERILTLFGEEIVPVPKPKAKRKAGEPVTPEQQGELADAPLADEQVSEGLLFAASEVIPVETQGVNDVPNAVAAVAVDSDEIPAEIPQESEAAPEAQTEVGSTTQDEGTANLPDDWHGDKQYYTIGEVAGLFKMKTSNVRFWTNEFGLKVRTTRKGDRLYTVAQVKELKAIYHLVKERGFTLSGAKAKLKTSKKKEVESVDLRELLLDLKGKLVAIRGRLGEPT